MSEDFELRYVLAPGKLVFRNSGIWAGGFVYEGVVLYSGEGISYIHIK